MNRRVYVGALSAVTLVVLVVDRSSKWIALNFFIEPVYINKFLTFDLTFNRGISGGFLHFDTTGAFCLVCAAVSAILVAIIIWTWHVYRQGGSIIGQVLIISGGFSNIIDRVIYGGVIDFISVSLNGWHWSILNIADIIINIGVLILILQSFFAKK